MLREDVKPGMTFRDMDRRMDGRLIKIDALKKITVDCGRFEAGETYARYKGGNGRVQWVNISRLVDLKEYELVDEGNPKPKPGPVKPFKQEYGQVDPMKVLAD